MRVRPVIAWLFFCLNVVLFATLVGYWALAHDPAASMARRNARAMGMDVYSVKDPFVILVNSASQEDGTFRFFRYGSPLIVDVAAVAADDGTEQRKVSLSLATDFEMSCVYSSCSDGNRVHVSELTIDVNNEHLVDLNADGRFDMRLNMDTRKLIDLPQPPEIWYKDRWCEVSRRARDSKYERQLPDGTIVRFDMKSGQWIAEE